jgi:hypothetical protein
LKRRRRECEEAAPESQVITAPPEREREREREREGEKDREREKECE